MPSSSASIQFPEMLLDAWRPTKNTLHLYLQIVGKIRLTMHPRINHWWHVPLYVSPRGLTMRTSGGGYEDFDLYDGLTVADFYSSVFANLAKLGIEPNIKAMPYEAPS